MRKKRPEHGSALADGGAGDRTQELTCSDLPSLPVLPPLWPSLSGERKRLLLSGESSPSSKCVLTPPRQALPFQVPWTEVARFRKSACWEGVPETSRSKAQ